MKTIRLNHLYQIFEENTPNEHQALKDCQLEINKGDFITVIGGNGAGKSTLLNILAGELTPSRGEITIDGTPLKKLTPLKKAQKIARVFQDPRLGTAGELTIEENFTLALKRGERKRLKKALTKENHTFFKEAIEKLDLHLEDRLNTKIGLLSGGQRQALTLLMATLKSPELLLLDEHTAALDPKTAKNVMTLTNQLVTEEKLTALMVTHNIQDAIDYGNRLIMLNQGQVIVDLKQEEKEKLTLKEVMALFSEKTGTILSDEQILTVTKDPLEKQTKKVAM